jgi:hypothetical protein
LSFLRISFGSLVSTCLDLGCAGLRAATGLNSSVYSFDGGACDTGYETNLIFVFSLQPVVDCLRKMYYDIL